MKSPTNFLFMKMPTDGIMLPPLELFIKPLSRSSDCAVWRLLSEACAETLHDLLALLGLDANHEQSQGVAEAWAEAWDRRGGAWGASK